TLLIRAYDGNDQHTIEYVPDGFSLFMADDFEYFKTHPRFFRLYLNYYTQTIPERDKVDRMIACLPPRHTPPDAA
ncbi:hypothetical protein IIZ77_01995, partial [Candidatus Saccharibacteria bacterium]|nr:hypothetical protein [Candidatus Saccharibacteria bacterium]